MKRKGNEIDSPVCFVIRSLPDEGSPNYKTPFGSAPFVSWKETRAALDEFVNNVSVSQTVDLITRSDEIVRYLKTKAPQEVVLCAEAVQNRLRTSIAEERRMYESENAGASKIQKEVDQLLEELQVCHDSKEALMKRKAETMIKIEHYKAEAAEELEEYDEMEAAMMQQVPRMKKGIALYARSTGIKWNYENLDVLAGEVRDSAKKVVRRFEFDPSEMDEFEIANRIWDATDVVF